MRHWRLSINLVSALKLSWLILYKIDIMSLELTLVIVFQSQNKVNENSLNLKRWCVSILSFTVSLLLFETGFHYAGHDGLDATVSPGYPPTQGNLCLTYAVLISII